MTKKQRNQYLEQNDLFWGRKNLTRLNEEKTFNRNLELVQRNDNENGLPQSSFERKKTRETFLQEIEIPKGYNMSLLKIPGFKLECELKSLGQKIRLAICENIPFKREFEEENSHVILLRIDSGFTIDNIAGLYRPFKIEINETAFSKAKIQLRNITDFPQDSYMNQFLGDINHNNNVQTSILNHVYVDDMSAVETITVEKKLISNHSLVYVTSSEKEKRTEFSEIKYQC